MPSSFTTNLRLTLPATGENAGTWGTLVNTGITTLIDSSIAGTASVTMTDANYTLTNLNGTTDEARCMFINLTGTLTATRNVICPSVSKLYFVYNNTTGSQAIVFKTSAGSGITIPNGKRAALYCNGTNVVYAFDQVSLTPTVTISGDINSTATDYGVNLTSTTIKSNVTTLAAMYRSNPATDAASFTLAALDGFRAEQSTFGVGSTVTTQRGFHAVSSLTGAQNNYGFYSDIATQSAVSISSISGSAGTVTVTTATAHGLTTGDTVLIAGVSDATMTSGSYNGGPYTVSVTNTTVFTFSSTAASPAISSSGSVVRANRWNFYAAGTGQNYFGGPVVVSANSVLPGLRVVQAGSGDSFVVEDAGGGDNTPFVINASGNVGIGTSAPTPGDVTGTPALTLRGTDARINIGTAASDMANGDIATLSFIAEDPRAVSSVVRNLAMIKAIYAGSNTTLDTNLTFSTAAASSTASERARITSNGFLLIGTTVSNAVGGSAGAGTLQIETPNSASNLSVARNTADATGPRVFLGKSRGAVAGGTTVVASGDSLGEIYFNGTDGTNYIPAALIAAQVDGTPGTNDMPGRLVFRTTADGASLTTERMRIDSAGNIIVANTTPLGGNMSVWGGLYAGANDSTAEIQTYRASTDTGGPFNYLNKARGTIAAPTIVSAGDDVGSVLFRGYDGAAYRPAAQIVAQVDGTPGAGDMPGRLMFYTTPDGTPTATERMRIDSAGNLGLGVTPSAWTGGRWMQIGSSTGVGQQANGITNLSSNAYESSSNNFTYIGSFAASRYGQGAGEHRFYVAPSGTAGNAISFTQAMTLDASGKLQVGTTTARGQITAQTALNVDNGISVVDTATSYANNNWYALFYNSTPTAIAGFSHPAANSLGVWGSDDIRFFTTNSYTERMRINSAGNVGIGTNSPSGKLDVTGSVGTLRIETTGNKISFTRNGANYISAAGGASASISYDAPVHYFNSGDGATTRMMLDDSGNLLVGTTSMFANRRLQADGGATPAGGFKTTSATNEVLTVWNSAASGDNRFIEFQTDAGNTARGSIDYNRAGGLVRYNTTSDYRAKDIIGPLTNTGATIDALKVYEGVMKGATQSRPMLVAHEAQEHAPYAVSGVKDEVNEDGTPKYQQIDVSSLVPLLLAEIQSLRARVAALEAN